MLTRLVATACAVGALTGLLAASPISPDRGKGPVLGNGQPQLAAGGPVSSPDAPTTPGSTGRKPFPKVPSAELQLPTHALTGKPTWNGRLLVKFRDELRMRADVIPGNVLRGADVAATAEATAVLANFGGTVRSYSRHTPEQLRALEMRAQAVSGKAQPDLAGMMYVDVRPEQLLATARAFNDLDIVEFVEIEQSAEQHSPQNFSEQDGCGQAGEDALIGQTTGINNCYTASVPPQGFPLNRCSALGGGGGCNDLAACNFPDGPQAPCRYGCNNANCCGVISSCLPGCASVEDGQGWDALCATYANVLCAAIGSVYDAGPPVGGSGDSVPGQYKFDPCFAMRGSIVPLGGAGGDVTIQGQPVTPDTPNDVSFGLMTYTLEPGTGSFVVGVDTLDAITYPTGSIVDEADVDSGVSQQALPDPSLEGAGGLISAGCFSVHPFGGCNQTTCCVYVCRVDPACCLIAWDDNCVAVAVNAPQPSPGSFAEFLGLGSPCASGALPTTPGVAPNTNFPPSGTTPLLTGGRQILPGGIPGNARGYQTYMVGQPVVDPFLPPPVTYPVAPPTQPSTEVPDPTRGNQAGNLGTLASINSGYRGGGLDLEGFEDLMVDLALDPVTNGRGQGSTIAVIDLSAYVEHEDLINRVNPEQGQTIILIDQDPIDPNHGTAVMGVIGAEDNEIGMTGIASGADLNFYPSVSIEEGERLLAAITSALIDLGEGDIICMPIGAGGNSIVANPAVNLLVTVGTSAGITTVCSAGNAGVEINAGPEETDSGAIIVSACWAGYRVGVAPTFAAVPGGLPGFNYCRYQLSNYGAASVVSGWGAGVASLGYGDLFNGDNAAVDPQGLTENKLRSYTSGNSFQGTSAATAIIAGWCARLQGFSLAFFGAALPAPTLRQSLNTPGNYFQQCGIAYDAPSGFPGFPENCPQYGDVVAGGQQARIGGFPRTRNTLAWLVANAFSGANPTEFDIITGLYQGGTAFSLRELDSISLQVGAVRKRAGNSGQGFGTKLFYPMSGGTTDVQLTVSSPQSPDAVVGVQLQAQSRVSWNLPVLQIIYFYNLVQQRWQPAGYAALTNQIGGGNYAPIGDIRDFLQLTPTGGSRIYARVYTCGLTTQAYTVLHDQLNFTLDVDIFNPGGGGGLGP